MRTPWRAVGLAVTQRCGAKVCCRDAVVGEHFVDMLIEAKILVR